MTGFSGYLRDAGRVIYHHPLLFVALMPPTVFMPTVRAWVARKCDEEEAETRLQVVLDESDRIAAAALIDVVVPALVEYRDAWQVASVYTARSGTFPDTARCRVVTILYRYYIEHVTLPSASVLLLDSM